ncbi:MAG: histidine kinase dimerization/phospho-acceptor domain-containing protein [Bdellovibrionota bacterium]
MALLALLLMQSAQLIGDLDLLSRFPLAARQEHLLRFASIFLTLGIFVATRRVLSTEIARLEVVSEHTTDGLLVLEGNAVAFANSVAQKIIKGPKNLNKLLEETKRSDMPVLFETMLEGSSRHFLISKTFIPRPSSRAAQHLFVFRDITFLRQNEQAKVDFIGTLSHEIKTPITSLTMALAMLDRTGFDTELVRIANLDVARLRALLEDLLNISKLKIVQNPRSLLKQEANLTALVHQIVRSAQEHAKERSILLKTRVQPLGQIIAKIDPTKIAWVLSTLVADAIRQSPHGKEVESSLDLQDERMTFSVKFSRAPEAPAPTGHPIVRDIIDAHDGSFEATQGEGQTQTYKFSLHAFRKQYQSTKGMGTNEANTIGR